MSTAMKTQVLDLRAIFGLTANITVPAEATQGAYVEMDCTAQPGSATLIHYHPRQEERYDIVSGVLDVFHDGMWQKLQAGESFTVPAGDVHGFRNSGTGTVRFINRHEPALGFQEHLVTLDRLVKAGKVRGTKDPRSLIYMSMSSMEHQPDVAVRPPQWVVRGMAFLGRRLGFSLDDPEPTHRAR